MKSLRRLILIFAIGLALPLGYLVVHSYRSLEAEEAATLGFFAEALFDEMQESAAAVIRREESRPIDAYTDPAATALPGLPAEEYIRGYFQNNPDGSFLTPHRTAPRADAKEQALRLAELEEANRVLRASQARFRAVMQSANDAIITVDRAGHDYLREMCDASRYVVIEDIALLPRELPALPGWVKR